MGTDFKLIMRLSIVIPVFNEEGSLLELYNQIIKALKIQKEYEIIFIDDGSSDDSKKISKVLLIKTQK